MKWEVKTGKNGKKYIRVDGNALICLIYNTKEGNSSAIEDAMAEQIVTAVNREVPMFRLEHAHVYDYNRHGIVAFISTQVQGISDKIKEMANGKKTYRVEVYDE